jgi:hypothetical protein
MFQSHVFFKNNSYNSTTRKRTKISLINIPINLTMLAEREGATATSLGILESFVDIFHREIIHRVPSVEGATATSLGNFNVTLKYIKINRKNAPNGVSLRFYKKTGGK